MECVGAIDQVRSGQGRLHGHVPVRLGGAASRRPLPPPRCLPVLLQGTQSTRFFLYDRQCRPLASSQVEFPQIYPHAG